MVEHNRLWVPVFGSFVIEGSTNVGKIPGSIKRTDCTNLQHQHRHAKKNRNAKLHNSRAKQRCVWTEMDTHTHLVGAVGKLPDTAVN